MFGIEKKLKQGLNIIIIGCGKVGRTLVDQLCQEGHDITVIDKSAKKVQDVANLYDVMGVGGNGASFSTQIEAGIKDADLVIAVTGSDELNLLCCTIAKQASDCSVIARVRTPDYNEDIPYLREKLGLARIKKAAEKKEKEEMIAQFYMLSDEDKADVIANIDTYSVDDIEAKLAILCVRNKVSFDLDNNKDGKENIPTVYNLNSNPEDDAPTPAWTKAAIAVSEREN